jgi:hypothetical protein
MELEIWEKQDKELKEPVRLRLVKRDSGDITLIAVDEEGEKIRWGNLLTLRSNGSVYRHEGINEDIGFNLDSLGRIVISPRIEQLE